MSISTIRPETALKIACTCLAAMFVVAVGMAVVTSAGFDSGNPPHIHTNR